jgi:hypothetical protein
MLTGMLLATSVSAASNMTAIEVYDDDSCTGAPLQIVFTPTDDCSSLTEDTNCSAEAQEMALFASGGCTDDPYAFAASTFAASPYVLVELHRPETNCTSLEGVAVYRLDGACHPTVDAGTSFQMDWDGVAPTLKLFSDAMCSSTPMFQLDLSIDSGECLGGSMRLFVSSEEDE